MPFKSEKQRRYMHANLPDIAKRWERDYSNGGIAELNQELNSLPEYYMPFPAAHGGLIPAHEAGIYGLAEGGQLVKPGPGRQGYQGWDPGAGAPQATSAAPPGERGGPGPTFEEQAAIETVAAPPGEKGGPGYISPEDQRTLDIQDIITRGEEEKIDYVEPPKKTNWLKTLGTWAAIYTGVAPILGIQTPTVVKLAADANTLYKNIDRGVKLGQKFNIIPKDFSTDEYLASIKNNALEYQKEQDLIQSLPKGHPERIQLEGLTKETITPERDNGRIQETSIKIEDIEGLNDKKAELASFRARQIQKKVDRSKQDAYYAAFRQKYLMGPTAMAAGGGRVPAGYNTGGLSNLFKLKNV